MDDSDRLPQSVRAQMRKTGSFVGAGEFLLEGIRPGLDTTRPIDIFAYSQGDSFGTGMAAGADQNMIRHLRIIDPAAMQKRGWLNMVATSAIKVSGHAKDYRSSSSADPESIALHNSEVLMKARRTLPLPKEIAARYDMYVSYPCAMGRAAIMSDMEQAIANISGEVSVIIPNKSEFNTVANVSTRLARLAIATVATINLFEFQDARHAFPEAHPNVLARLATL
ncbi:MAG: hypothetical protein ACHQTE_01675, partial [Candidatus Saccharimonadales bacterium]